MKNKFISLTIRKCCPIMLNSVHLKHYHDISARPLRSIVLPKMLATLKNFIRQNRSCYFKKLHKLLTKLTFQKACKLSVNLLTLGIDRNFVQPNWDLKIPSPHSRSKTAESSNMDYGILTILHIRPAYSFLGHKSPVAAVQSTEDQIALQITSR